MCVYARRIHDLGIEQLQIRQGLSSWKLQGILLRAVRFRVQRLASTKDNKVQDASAMWWQGIYTHRHARTQPHTPIHDSKGLACGGFFFPLFFNSSFLFFFFFFFRSRATFNPRRLVQRQKDACRQIRLLISNACILTSMSIYFRLLLGVLGILAFLKSLLVAKRL